MLGFFGQSYSIFSKEKDRSSRGPNEVKKTNTRRSFSEKFKQEAVQLLLDGPFRTLGGRTIGSLGAERALPLEKGKEFGKPARLPAVELGAS